MKRIEVFEYICIFNSCIKHNRSFALIGDDFFEVDNSEKGIELMWGIKIYENNIFQKVKYIKALERVLNENDTNIDLIEKVIDSLICMYSYKTTNLLIELIKKEKMSERKLYEIVRLTISGDIVKTASLSRLINQDRLENMYENYIKNDKYYNALLKSNVGCNWIKELLILREQTNEEILKRLICDGSLKYIGSDVVVSSAYICKLYRLGGRCYDGDVIFASNVSTPVEVLRELAESKNNYVRIAVGKNPSTSDDILRKLKGDGDFDVIEAVVNNDNVSNDVVDEMMGHHLPRIRGAAIRAKNKRNEKRDIIENPM